MLTVSNFHFVVVLSLGLSLLATGSPDECTTTVEGYTWAYDENIDELVIGVDTVDLCFQTCAEDSECQGYTWTNAGVVQLCYKFKHQLDGFHECVACSSGVLPQSLDGACVGDYDEILDVGPAGSIQECRQFCYEIDGCQAYTWWDNTTSFINTCFLYGACQTQLPCAGCESGRNTCIFTKPDHCKEYMVLDEDDRNVDHYNKGCRDENNTYVCYCDKDEASFTSSDWQGPGYYRIQSSAGTRLPESSPGESHCGTTEVGWLSGEHHQNVFAEESMTVCFDSTSYKNDTCYYEANVTVTNCDGFYVYKLPDTPTCNLRYCAAN